MPLNNPAIETAKLDLKAANGLLGVDDSLAYRIGEVERHSHSYERWFAAAAVPDGTAHVADHITTGVTAFQADAGNNTWGAWLQILGSSDTPITAGSAYYDLHLIQVEDVERIAAHFVQIAYGDDPDAALAAGLFSDSVFHPPGVTGQATPIDIKSRREPAGTKAWLRLKVPAQNTGTMNFYFGLHEYEG